MILILKLIVSTIPIFVLIFKYLLEGQALPSLIISEITAQLL